MDAVDVFIVGGLLLASALVLLGLRGGGPQFEWIELGDGLAYHYYRVSGERVASVYPFRGGCGWNVVLESGDSDGVFATAVGAMFHVEEKFK